MKHSADGSAKTGLVIPGGGSYRVRVTARTPEGASLVRNPVSMSRTTLPDASCAPEPGEHTDAVLAELGFSADDVERLRRLGVV